MSEILALSIFLGTYALIATEKIHRVAAALGADFRCNATAIAAAANIIVIGIAAKRGHPISFWESTR